MAVSPEQRQLVIDLMAEELVNQGLLDDVDATDFATQSVDEAIRRQQDS